VVPATAVQPCVTATDTKRCERTGATMTDLRDQLADALPATLGPIGFWRDEGPGRQPRLTGYGEVLSDLLLPVVQAAITEARADERRTVIAEYAAQIVATARESYSNGYSQGRRVERGETP